MSLYCEAWVGYQSLSPKPCVANLFLIVIVMVDVKVVLVNKEMAVGVT